MVKRDFLGSMKDAGILFLGGREKTQRFFWVLYFSSAQINNNNISAIYCWCAGMIFGYANYDVGIFWGIKHGLPSPPPPTSPPVIKISECGTWAKGLTDFFSHLRDRELWKNSNYWKSCGTHTKLCKYFAIGRLIYYPILSFDYWELESDLRLF